MATDPLHYYAAEWRRVLSSPGLGAVAAEWSRLAPELPAPQEIDAALAEARERSDHALTNTVLHGLLRCAGAGGSASRVAAVAVSAQLEPGMGRVVTQVRGSLSRAGRTASVAEVRTVVAGALWETVRTFPLHRHRAIAANIVGTTINVALRSFDCHDRSGGHGFAVAPEDLRELALPAPPIAASEELVLLLSWAVTERYVTSDESELVLRRWASGNKPASAQVIADEHGWSRRTTHRRCENAVAALTAAVHGVAA
jgi:hypothetical protein